MKISIILEALTGMFETDMNRASKTAQKRMKEIERDAARVGKQLGVALAAGAAAAVVAINTAIDRADQLNEVAQKIGLPVDVLSGLDYAAKLGGVATEELQGGLIKMIKFQAEAANGGKEALQTFEKLGIKIRDGAGNLRGAGDLFRDFADVFKRIPENSEQALLAVRVFGKSGAELIPVLNGGAQSIADYAAELDKLGGTVTPEAAARADEFKDNVDKLKTAAGGLALQVANDLLPDLIELTNTWLENAKAGDGVAETAHNITEAFRFVVDMGKAAVDAVQGVSSVVIGMGVSAKGVLQGLFGDFKGAAEAFRNSRREFLQAGVEFGIIDGPTAAKTPGRIPATRVRGGRGMGADLKKGPDLSFLTDGPSASAKSGKKSSGLSEAEKDAKRLDEAYHSLNDRMAETIALFGKTSEEAKVRYDLEHGELAKLSEAKKGELIDQAKTLDLLEREKVFLDERNKAEEERLKLHADAQDAVADLLSDMQFELDLLGKTNAERITANELRRIGIGLTEEERAAAEVAIEAKARELEQQQRLTAAMDEFRQNFEDSLTDVLTGAKSIGQAFSDLADMVVQQIARMIAQQWTAQLFGGMGTSGGGFMSSLFGAFSGGGGGGGWAGANALANFGGMGGGFANGTDYAPGGWAMVGEQGPEKVFLPEGSRVMPNHRVNRERAGGGMVQQNTFITQGRPSERSQRQQAQLAGRAARRAEVF
jgi:hypothetical protein